MPVSFHVSPVQLLGTNENHSDIAYTLKIKIKLSKH